MATLGSPKTSKYNIGAFELRIGPMTAAGRLGPQHSVGVAEDLSVGSETSTVELLGGFPQVMLDSAVSRLSSTIGFKIREYSARNMNMMLGNSPISYPNAGGDKIGTIAAGTLAADATAITVTAMASAFTVGDTVVIYQPSDPQKTTVSTVAAATTTSITLTTGQGLVQGMSVTAQTPAYIYLAQTVGFGNLTSVNYFSASVLATDRATSRPIQLDFWKCAVKSGLRMGWSVTDFGSADVEFDILKPAEADYAVGAPLANMAAVIPSNPFCRYSMPLDVL